MELMRFRVTEENMVNALEIGLQCVVPVPDNRPTMDAIVSMIEQTCPGTCTTARSRRKQKNILINQMSTASVSSSSR